MKSQVAELPALPEDANEEQKKARSQELVKIDAKEMEVERQEKFYNYVINNEI